MPDEQDRAEELDDEKVEGEFPPERPLGAHRRQDDAIPESYAGRGARTEPEVDEADEPDEAVVDETGTPEAAEEAALHLRESTR